MKALRLSGAVVLVAGLVQLGAAPAVAAPPANDEAAGAVVMRLGSTVVQDTRQATTTAQDATLNADCGAPATNASVWYKYTPGKNRNLVLDVARSDYTAGMMVFEGSPRATTMVACGPDQIALTTTARRTYYVMVFSDSSVNGGRLVMSMRTAPPPPRVHVTIARRGLAYRGGAARLHGWYFCQRAGGAELDGKLVQRAGRLKIPAEFFKELRCNGRRHPWTALVVSETGTYARGRARARATISACGLFDCRDASVARRVRLRWAPRKHAHRLAAPQPMTRLAPPRPLVQQERHWVDRSQY